MVLLVAGGQLDPNIGRLLRRVLERKLPFVDVLAGPGTVPVVSIEYPKAVLRVSGLPVSASAAFLRHDAFWQEESSGGHAQTCALNWYYLVSGWARVHDLRMFNSATAGVENNKIGNLVAAQRAGLAIPETLVTNDLEDAWARMGPDTIVKQVAGGSYTRTLSDVLEGWKRTNPIETFPRFVQRRLCRPEMRVYIAGDDALAFSIESDDLDYREHGRAKVKSAETPSDIEAGLRKLCSDLGLTFAAADFMRHPDDGHYCFLEINAQPMFVAFDLASEGRLIDAMLDFLTRDGTR
jgi:hypothetical protein